MSVTIRLNDCCCCEDDLAALPDTLNWTLTTWTQPGDCPDDPPCSFSGNSGTVVRNNTVCEGDIIGGTPCVGPSSWCQDGEVTLSCSGVPIGTEAYSLLDAICSEPPLCGDCEGGCVFFSFVLQGCLTAVVNCCNTINASGYWCAPFTRPLDIILTGTFADTPDCYMEVHLTE